MSKSFWKAVAIRTVRTMCQTAVATIGSTAVATGVDWMLVIDASALAGILCVLSGIATGLPEAEA